MANKQIPSRKEESILQIIFSNFTNFNFDKAREQAEKERDLARSVGGPLWVSFLNLVAQLAIAEKLNMNLGFLATKSFLRKENSVRASYVNLLVELSDLEKRHTPSATNRYEDVILDSVKREDQANSDGLLAETGVGTEVVVLLHLCTHLKVYMQARIEIISFYECLISSSGNNWMNYEQLYKDILEISNKYSKHFHHPVLGPLKTNYTFECDILGHLLGCLNDMQNWSFFQALLHLDGSQSKLTAWQVLLQSKETKKYAFLKSCPLPPLYQWLVSAKAALVCKFSLYFYETLTNQSSPPELKGLMSKLSVDYVAKIHAFQKKSDARCICLILDTTQIPEYKGHGYHHPSSPNQQLTGIQQHPAIFSYPSKADEIWDPMITKYIECRKDSISDKIQFFYDNKVRASCFYCSADPAITLMALFTAHKSERDNYIADFISDMAHQLRGVKIFASLKPK